VREGWDKTIDWEVLSLLHECDPLRVDAEKELKQPAGAGELDHALQMKAQAAALRVALSRVEVPTGLMSRLMKVPAQLSSRWYHREIGWRDAAVFVLMAGIAWGVYFGRAFWDDYRHERNLATATNEVAQLHFDQVSEIARTGNVEVLVSALRKARPNSWTAVYQPQDGVTLEGGGTTELDGHPVYFTKYKRNGKEYTLYQLGEDEFGLADDFGHRWKHVDGPGGRVVVEAWPDDIGLPCGWMLVSKEGEEVTAKDLVKRSGATRWGPPTANVSF
jgi:hypothetical protein